MTDTRSTAALIGGIGLLERGINYALGSLHLVSAEMLSHPTPCREWDIRALLCHVDDSLTALYEATDGGRVELNAARAEAGAGVDPVAAVRDRACQLIGAWTSAADGQQPVGIDGSHLTSPVVTTAGALEIAVHGWDLARACRRNRPIPPSLAEEMLELSPLFVADADRPARFAAPIELPRSASSSDRLVAFLGRHP